MQRTRLATVALTAAAALTLVGCTPGDPTPGATDAPSGDGGAGGGTTAECLSDRTWVLDLDDLAQQLGDNLSANGLAVSQATGEGRQTFVFHGDRTAEGSVDVTFTITVDASDGLQISVVQTHSGSPAGDWSLSGDIASFSGWNNDYSIQNTVLVNGVAGDFPITVPDSGLDGTDLTITCSGDTMSTKAAVSPFTQHWTAEG